MKFNPVSLQEESYIYISENLSVFVDIYSRTKTDEIWQKAFFFLQRGYSQRLIYERIYKKFLIDDTEEPWGDHHFDLLVNTYVELIDLEYLLSGPCKHYDVGQVIGKLIPFGPNYKRLNIYDDMYQNSRHEKCIKELLYHVPNIEEISTEECDNELIQIIASSCPKLIELHINGCIKDVNFRTLCTDSDGKVRTKFPLKVLNIMDCDVTGEDILYLLEHIPTLEELKSNCFAMALWTIHKTKTDENFLLNVKYNLRRICYQGDRFPELSPVLLKICADLCPLVKELTVDISSSNELEMCRHFLQLENINISGDFETPLNVCNFLSMTNGRLKKLFLNYCTVTLNSVLEHCPKLHFLSLVGCKIHEQNLKTSNVLHSLNTLELDSHRVKNEFYTKNLIDFFKFCPNLKSLSVTYYASESTFFHELSTLSLGIEYLHLYDVDGPSFDRTNPQPFEKFEKLILSLNSVKNLNYNYPPT